MSTYFEKLQRNYKDVPVTDEGIDTVAFLEATEGVVKLFDLLNSKAFTMVQKDMNGNIEKIKKRYNTDPKKNNTLENLVINEKGEKTRTATEGLLWLKRGLEFTSKALRSSLESAKSANGPEELSNSFTKSYEVTLKQFHGVLVRPVFKMAMTYCPSRQELFQKLGDDQKEVNQQLEEWLAAFEQIVERLDQFYKQGGHDKGF